MKDSNCVFCKVAAGELPSYKVYEDENFLAILDIHPLTAGHVQVIPKDHHRWVWDVPNVGEYFEVVRKVAQAQKNAFDTEMIRCQIYGNEVAHAHIWVFPDAKGESASDFEGNREKIRKYLEEQK